jgi:site-specific recombinase XerD
MKKFFKLMEGNGEDYPDKVKWIKTSGRYNHNKLPEDLLTQEEIRDMIKAADNPRDKALLFVLYESGCRFSELMYLKLKNIQFDKYGAQIAVSGKTGSRRIRLIMACDYLRYWIENHPDRANPEAPLWVSMANANKGTILKYACVRKRICEIAGRAGIKKKVNPHNFRHSRATHLASKLKTAQLCIMFGWAQHSRMPSTYIHLSGEDVDDALLKMHGLKKDEEGETISCPRCHKPHPTTANYCNDCGMPFNVRVFAEADNERDRYDDMMSKLLENEDVKKAIMKAMKEGR